MLDVVVLGVGEFYCVDDCGIGVEIYVDVEVVVVDGVD